MRPYKYLVLAAAAVVALSWVATPADAQGRRGGYGGYRGGYGGYYRGGYSGFYPRYGYGYTRPGYWGYPGIGLGGYRYGRLNYGYRPGYSYYGGYYPTYSYGTGYAPTYDYVPSYSYGTVYAPTVGSPAAIAATMAETGSTRASGYYAPPTDNTARIRVRLPANAGLWVAGEQMQQTGPEREFASPVLTPGKSYHYEMTARWKEGDRPVEQTRRVNVRANETAEVTFGPEK